MSLALPLVLLLLPTAAAGACQVIYSMRTAPVMMRIAIVLTAGIAEEFIFRGYLFERVATLTGSRTFAALASWTAFVPTAPDAP